jgi:rRNA maturation endonuclease Nob1
MITIEAKQIGDVIEPKYEVKLECAHCGMPVDDVEYANETCSDCGKPWEEKRHTAIHVTSVPLSGDLF